MIQPCASVTVAGLSGDSGKTLVALGLAAGWAKKGLRVAPFKKGPDYIDAAWLSLAAQAPCRNLDTFLMTDEAIRRTWDNCCQRSDVSVIEGNRGLFDGIDAEGSHSTAELAKRLHSPVILVVDATKVTATLAAIVLGVRQFDPSLILAGVILNRVGGARHEKVAREAIETHTDIKVFGAIPRVKGGGGKILPGRHLGLITVDEHPRAKAAIDAATSLVQDHVDVDALFAAQRGEDAPLTVGVLPQAGISTFPDPPHKSNHPQIDERILSPAPLSIESTSRFEATSLGTVRIAVLRDRAFSFYYPENLEALQLEGAEIVSVDSLHDSALPEDIHALYIGGGFPETHAARIAKNRPFLDAIRIAAENGLPIYAECGGLMLLCESIEFDDQVSRMAGVFPHQVGWSKKPSGHGYTMGVVTETNPFYPVGTRIRGHEFHYSHLQDLDGDPDVVTVLKLSKGVGVGSGRDGLIRKNVLAMYTHTHAAGTTEWAEGMLAAARRYAQRGD